MSVYTDGTHLVADSFDELHRFARKMGLKREWFQTTRVDHPHYDLTTRKARKRAIELGAKKVTRGEVLEAMGRMIDRNDEEKTWR